MRSELRTNNACRGAGAGARLHKRQLDRDEVLARKAHWHLQPPSAERDRALRKTRSQLASIANRVENRT